MKVSAYIPCFNNAKTIKKAILSILEQSFPIDDFFVIDDGSTDKSVNIIKKLNVPVYVNPKNNGRGYIRNKSTVFAKNELILCLDASKRLDKDFVHNAIHHFKNDNIAAIIGKIGHRNTNNFLDRWRNIHLFKSEHQYTKPTSCGLITYGTLIRKQAILEAGNYDEKLTQLEDTDLGNKLHALNWKIFLDPNLYVDSLTSDSYWMLLERYWRWYASQQNEISIQSYIQNFKYSLFYMAKKDIKDRDFKRLLLSLICPHYQFFKSIKYI
jgi:glycosyltransferase involved in cell wall biosynthesis